jgi:TolA-binding protein
MKLIFLFSVCLFLLLPAAWAQNPLSPAEMASSVLLKQARYLLESRKAKEAIPFLEEVLVRLQELDDEKARQAKQTALYQLGLCCLEAGEYDKAAETFKRFLTEYPEHENAQEAQFLVLESLAWQKGSGAVTSYIHELEQSGGFNELIAVLERKDDTTRHTVLSLLSAYARTADFENWQRFLPFCDEDGRSDMDLNLSLMAGGDLAVEQKDYLKALRFYRQVWLSDELQQAYDRRLAALKAVLETPLPWVPLAQREAQTARRKAEEERCAQMLSERKQLEERNYDQDLMLRMAQCYDGMERRWNAFVLYRHLCTTFPESRAAERSRYAAFQCLAALEELDEAKAEGGIYLEMYPAGRYRDAVTLRLMQVHLQMDEPDAAEALGQSLREQNPQHRYLDQVLYLLGTVRFGQRDYEAALELFERTASEWPERIYAEESVYWEGMCNLFLGRFSAAAEVFEGYLSGAEWSPKEFEEDVTYRLGMARYGLEDDEGARQIFERFLEQFPDSDLCSEAWSMLGDLHGADGDMDAALACYAQARSRAVHIGQESYAVFQAAQVYDLLGRQQNRIQLLQDYLKMHGDAGEMARAVLEISSARQALGQPEGALDAYVDAIVGFGDRAELEDVDRLLGNLLKEALAPSRGGISAGAVVRRLTPIRQMALNDADRKTLTLRLTALLAALTAGDEQAAFDRFLLEEESPEKLTRFPLRRFAEAAAARGLAARAAAAAERFMERYGDSEDALPVGNVQIELLIDAERYEAATALAEENLTRFPGHPAAARTHLLAADALRLSQQYDRAVDMYREFASIREWRGPLTPKALYSIGLCAMEQGKPEEACAWFQRVYVLYGEYPEWTARAYVASFQCLEKLGRTDEAQRTLREMLSIPALANTPEGQRAGAELSGTQEVGE